MSNIQYYLNEEKNMILVSGSSTKAGMNALLTSSKDPSATFDPNLTAKISSLGMNTTYVVQNGNDNTSFNINDNQELWVYRGYNQQGGTDGETYRYNPHLHRPYKAYILTETGSGVPGFPYLPTGSAINTNAQSNTGGDIISKYIERQLSIVGNTSNAITSSEASGSFKIYDDTRGIHPFVFTKYHTLPVPNGIGAAYFVYREGEDFQDPRALQFNTSTASPSNPGTDKVAFNSSTINSITQVYIQNDLAVAQVLGPLSASINRGKDGGSFRVDNGNNNEFIEFNIDTIDVNGLLASYWIINVSSPSTSTPFTLFGNNAPISASVLDFPMFKTTIEQQQGTSQNIVPYL